MKIVVAQDDDPFFNLSVEEYLLETMDKSLVTLFLWQSRGAVVIGKNQNPWLETNPALLRQDGVPLARRISGGGAVYHDRGNLNYSFFLPRSTYKPELPFTWILDVLKRLGMQAERCGKNSLCIQNKKISGNAFCYRGNKVLHHGTLLVHANLQNLEKYLRPSSVTIQTKAVSSIRADVMNLADVKSGLRVEEVIHTFLKTFKENGAELLPVSSLEAGPINKIIQERTALAWRYGHTPGFECRETFELERGRVILNIHVVKGRIAQVNIQGKGYTKDELSAIGDALKDCPLEPNEWMHRLRDKKGRYRNPLMKEFACKLEARF